MSRRRKTFKQLLKKDYTRKEIKEITSKRCPGDIFDNPKATKNWECVGKIPKMNCKNCWESRS